MLKKHEITVKVMAQVVLIVFVSIVAAQSNNDKEKEISLDADDLKFSVDHTNNVFLLNGEKFQYVSGSMHYFRSTPQSWRDKLRVMRGAGLNAVDTYIYWALHNPHDGVYNFEGMADVEQFIKIAQEEDFYIILRPSPYICAEIDNGGIPHWLFTKYEDIKLRTSDPNYLAEVEKWFAQLMPKFKPYLLGNGGKIIMVQVENEYGIYSACDNKYMDWLTEQTKSYVDDSVLLFTTDIPNGTINCAHELEGVYRTIDFGADRGDTELEYLWGMMRTIQKTGPYVNSEYYPGWLTHWQEENQRRDSDLIARVLKKMLETGASVNFYMMHGGTNFGFTAGANDWGIGSYKADLTSYDYDAPLDEAGDSTEKLEKIREVIMEFLPAPPYEIPAKSKKMSMNDVVLDPVALLLSDVARSNLASVPVVDSKPKTFEQLDQFSGFVLYETTIPELFVDPTQLTVNGLRDRAQVIVGGVFVGTLSRENVINTLPIHRGLGSKLQILVENQGRVNFNIANDIKGILDTVTIQMYDGELHELTNWTSTGFPFENYTKLESLFQEKQLETVNLHHTGVLVEGPVIFRKEFMIESDEIYDTWIDPTGWSKGIIFINGFNLGRYWPLVGPQITLYLPKDLLKPGTNEIVVVELQKADLKRTLSFVDAPIWTS